MIRPRVAAFLFIFSLLPAACAGPRSSLSEPDREAYLAVLEAWTRQGIFYDKAEKLMRLGATLESPAYLAAREKYSRELFLDSASPSPTPPPGPGEVSFHLALYIPRFKENRLGDKDAIWRVFLREGEGPLISPSGIENVKDPEALRSLLYPYASPWTVQYRVVFPLKGGEGGKNPGGPLKLLIAGPRGRAEVAWNDLSGWEPAGGKRSE